MKVKITIEQFQNGISIKWRNDAGNTEHIVALAEDAEEELGRIVLEHFAEMKCGKAEITIDCKPVSE